MRVGQWHVCCGRRSGIRCFSDGQFRHSYQNTDRRVTDRIPVYPNDFSPNQVVIHSHTNDGDCHYYSWT
jgi:hypothetical protein